MADVYQIERLSHISDSTLNSGITSTVTDLSASSNFRSASFGQAGVTESDLSNQDNRNDNENLPDAPAQVNQ